jgi:tetratricopeptide (TPR) repeat protein
MEQKRRWIIKGYDGRVRGPYATAKLIHKINLGEITGEEMIALYPGGNWFPISQEPEFYDRLLDALSGADGRREGSTATKQEGTTEQRSQGTPLSKTEKPERTAPPNGEPPPPKGEPPPRKVEFTQEPAGQRGRAQKLKSDEVDETNSVIELTNVGERVKQEVFRQIRLPVVVAVGIGILFLVWMSNKAKVIEQEERVHLVPLAKALPQGQPAVVHARITKAMPDFLRDTYSGYTRAENDFVQIMQVDARNSEVLALLCLTYNELWPYSFQDSQDLRAVSTAAQMASQIDPGGQNSGVCKVVDLLVRGRSSEAKSIVNSVLESSANNEQPPIIFYYLKAILLESAGELQTAIGYVGSAQQLWSKWLRVFVYGAQLQGRLNNFSEAQKMYGEVLRANPGHLVARLELGLIEYKQFRQLDHAQELLISGLKDEREKVPRELASRAYMGLAEIALEKKDSAKALSYAQQAYSQSSSNVAAKNLIIQLGGVEKLRKTKVKGQHLMYEGDQFVREGDCESAQAHFKAAYEEDHKNSVAAMKAARCLWQLSLTTEAIEWLNKSIVADPKLIEAYVLLSDYYTQRFNFDAAARILASAQHQAPKSYEVYRGFALIELRRNNPQGAINYAKRAIALYETDGESYIVLAKAYLAMQGRDTYDLAYQAATKATEIDVNNREAQIVYAEALAALQGVDVGLEHLKRLVATYPLVFEYQVALAKILISDERYDAAESVLRRVVRIDEKPKKALIMLAKVLKNQNHVEEALETLLKAAILDPADPQPLFEAGLLYLEFNKANEARSQFERVLAVNPSYPLVHYYIGRAALLAHRPDEAVNQANLEKKVDPNAPEAHLLAADANAEMKQYSIAASEYEQALRLRPQGAKIYVKVARCYRLANNYDIASSMLDIAEKKESGYAEIYKERGQLYELQNDYQRAIEAYNQYFVLDPNAPDRFEIEQRMVLLQQHK